MDGANWRYLPTARPRPAARAAILTVAWLAVKHHQHTGLLDSAGFGTVDWRRHHMRGIPWMDGARQSQVWMSTAVNWQTQQVNPDAGPPQSTIDNW
ncbi:MAG: hypothetical protein A3G76_09835 [Acidobacteria bacterium RIFCSPLOWO2_12_FULL_65_11]|nr:MAG: hypothetical protein A3H95_00595 [Acidobacteria bacterium RIFCSPLOWO2_02_FULL_64_15]OFW32583.1 MAG: hypothetical protein A3G76_09835 [Acidobacteria bacterium RIFCSPLOWO2_12_FULL_65_11]